ncbi:chaperone Ric-8B [Denticeps clupeoides]|uniref:Synembryn n=1 Tax=Denticeps clupeoides TaxID=299321 RepID=A0AAY4BN54_9TELE|nr:synembryn-B [Denticeps clupeoides]
MELTLVLSQIESENDAEMERVLKQYNTENGHTFTFDPKEEDARIRLCRGLVAALGRPLTPRCQSTCLETLRILSRDKRVLAPVGTREGILTLARLAQIRLPAGDAEEKAGSGSGSGSEAEEERVVVVESLKCMCNIVFNSADAQQAAADVQLAQGLCALLRASTPAHHEVGLFSLRLLFLLSALRLDVREDLCREMRALTLLTQLLERVLDVRWVGPYEAAAPSTQTPPVPYNDNERAMEALKALFNITMSDSSEEDADHQLRLIVAIMRHLLLLRTQTEEKTEEAHSHAINLLSNIQASCLDVLVDVPMQGGLEEYGGKNMDVIQVLLDFMEKRIDRGANYKEGLTPVLSLLTESSRQHRDIRRYLKARVLPPLKDVRNRPEVGSTLRNKLVRLMTHVDMGVKQSAAEFLFVLCKESVDSLVKYTGYGSAAGLLLARGLLGGGRGETQYSEDEDSDTEEYKSAKPFINPITGHVEEPMPFEEMTEEQKEYEAQKLANMFDQLTRQQLIKPMGVRKDGTLVPLEKTVGECTINSSDSDSD